MIAVEQDMITRHLSSFKFMIAHASRVAVISMNYFSIIIWINLMGSRYVFGNHYEFRIYHVPDRTNRMLIQIDLNYSSK